MIAAVVCQCTGGLRLGCEAGGLHPRSGESPVQSSKNGCVTPVQKCLLEKPMLSKLKALGRNNVKKGDKIQGQDRQFQVE